MTDTHLPPHWAEALCAVCRIPPNPENIRFLHAWAQAEGGTARWNPLNSTYPLAWGASNYNSSAVKNYSQPVGGICATALTLATSHNPDGTLTFGHLLGDLQAGIHTAVELVDRNEAQIEKWGTNPSTIRTVLAVGY